MLSVIPAFWANVSKHFNGRSFNGGVCAKCFGRFDRAGNFRGCDLACAPFGLNGTLFSIGLDAFSGDFSDSGLNDFAVISKLCCLDNCGFKVESFLLLTVLLIGF